MLNLIIPDIHHKFTKAEAIIEKITETMPIDKIIFLGDYFDDFGDTVEKTRQTALWLKWSLSQKNRVHLVGNHDLAYYDDRYSCSGFTQWKSLAILDVFRNEKQNLGDLVITKEYDGVLYSHAGFSDNTFSGVYESLSLLEADKSGRLPVLAACSPLRGGTFVEGGPLWRDWSEGVRLWNWTQVVGHTPGEEPRYRAYEKDVTHGLMCADAHCIDTHLRHYAIVAAGRVEVREV